MKKIIELKNIDPECPGIIEAVIISEKEIDKPFLIKNILFGASPPVNSELSIFSNNNLIVCAVLDMNKKTEYISQLAGLEMFLFSHEEEVKIKIKRQDPTKKQPAIKMLIDIDLLGGEDEIIENIQKYEGDKYE